MPPKENKSSKYFLPILNAKICLNIDTMASEVSGFIYILTSENKFGVEKIRSVIPDGTKLLKVTNNLDQELTSESKEKSGVFCVTIPHVEDGFKIFFNTPIHRCASGNFLPRLMFDQVLPSFDVYFNIDNKLSTVIMSPKYTLRKSFFIKNSLIVEESAVTEDMSAIRRNEYQAIFPEKLSYFSFIVKSGQHIKKAKSSFEFLFPVSHEKYVENVISRMEKLYAGCKNLFPKIFFKKTVVVLDEDCLSQLVGQGMITIRYDTTDDEIKKLLIESILKNNIYCSPGHEWIVDSLTIFMNLFLIKSYSGSFEYDLQHVLLIDHMVSMDVPALISKINNMSKVIKGYCFYRFLLEIVDDELSFHIFLGYMLSTYQFKTLNTKEMVESYINYFMNKENPGNLKFSPNNIRWNEWFNSEGPPPDFELNYSEKMNNFIEEIFKGKSEFENENERKVAQIIISSQ